jgi:hypothetical protein
VQQCNMAKASLLFVLALFSLSDVALAQNSPPPLQVSACNAIQTYRQTITAMQMAYAREPNPIKKAELGPPIQAKVNELYAVYQNSFPGNVINNFVGQVIELEATFQAIRLRVKLCDVLQTVTDFGSPVIVQSDEAGVLLEPFRAVLRELAVGNNVAISGTVYAFDVGHKQLCFGPGQACGAEVLRIRATSLTKQ